jgi:hypothetical protein
MAAALAGESSQSRASGHPDFFFIVIIVIFSESPHTPFASDVNARATSSDIGWSPVDAIVGGIGRMMSGDKADEDTEPLTSAELMERWVRAPMSAGQAKIYARGCSRTAQGACGCVAWQCVAIP